jgi:hypothetical protein
MTQLLKKSHRPPRQSQWRRQLQELMDQIEHWSHENHWLVDRHEAPIDEPQLGAYLVPVLHIHLGNALSALVVEPAGADITDAQGRVDIYSLRNFSRFRIVRRGDHWHVFDDRPRHAPRPWSKKTFESLVKALTAP